MADADLQRKLWAEKNKVLGGGFEATLEDVRREAGVSGDTKRVRRLEDAITRLFKAMDQAFSNAYPLGPFRFEFSRSNSNQPVAEFLTRFDAIFTLNQDLLLERHYFEHMPSSGRWEGFQIPGMKVSSDVMPQQGDRVWRSYVRRSAVEARTQAQSAALL
jgi:hypothetical protein